MFIIYLVIGYVAAVVFPVPVVSRTILDLWTKLGAYFSSTPTTPPAA